MERAGIAPAPPIRQDPIATAVAVEAAGSRRRGRSVHGRDPDDTMAVDTGLSPDEVTRTLDSLADLRDRGAITAEPSTRPRRRSCSAACRCPGPATADGRPPGYDTRTRPPEVSVLQELIARQDHPDRDLPARSVPGPRVRPCVRRLPAGRRHGQDVRAADPQPASSTSTRSAACSWSISRARRRVPLRLGQAHAGQPDQPARPAQRRGPRGAGRPGVEPDHGGRHGASSSGCSIAHRMSTVPSLVGSGPVLVRLSTTSCWRSSTSSRSRPLDGVEPAVPVPAAALLRGSSGRSLDSVRDRSSCCSSSSSGGRLHLRRRSTNVALLPGGRAKAASSGRTCGRRVSAAGASGAGDLDHTRSARRCSTRCTSPTSVTAWTSSRPCAPRASRIATSCSPGCSTTRARATPASGRASRSRSARRTASRIWSVAGVPGCRCATP